VEIEIVEHKEMEYGIYIDGVYHRNCRGLDELYDSIHCLIYSRFNKNPQEI